VVAVLEEEVQVEDGNMKIQRSSIPFLFFSKKEKTNIVKAIINAEKATSGEIRVHLAHKFKGDIFGYSKKVFENLGMTKTEQRNGVLVLFNIIDRKFVILGDKGINDKVPADFWNSIVNIMQENFFRQKYFNQIQNLFFYKNMFSKIYFKFLRFSELRTFFFDFITKFSINIDFLS
jgi:uncharacterized membrane protein